MEMWKCGNWQRCFLPAIRQRPSCSRPGRVRGRVWPRLWPSPLALVPKSTLRIQSTFNQIIINSIGFLIHLLFASIDFN